MSAPDTAVSVVIPTLNEESLVGSAVRSALAAGATEVIVSDGGSSDATLAAATRAGATTTVRSLPGRGVQLNAGSTFATGQLILFLHADSQLNESCLRQIAATSRHARDPADAVWGAFRQRIDHPARRYRLLEWGNSLRVQVRRLPFGDQAVFVRRSTFKQMGGFAEVPLMEDVELAARLRKICRPVLLDGPVTVSPRRWHDRGVVRQTLRNWKIQSAYALGASPERLRHWYSR